MEEKIRISVGDSRGTDRLQPFLAVYRLGKQLNSGFFRRSG
ncbi:hypothetical protein [Rhizobium herbae]|nr:hypothetical protein [Rhizobium herbae]